MLTQEEAYQQLNVQTDLIPLGSSNRPGTPLTPTHITIHNTANAGAGADAHMHSSYVKGPDARARQVSWHFTIDDQVCIKHLPTTEKGWHAGHGNGRSIGIEICEHAGMDKAAAMDRASLLTAVLMLALDIPPEHVVPHKFWTGKDCPRVVMRESGGFDAFRRRAADYLDQLRASVTFAIEGSAIDTGAANSASPLTDTALEVSPPGLSTAMVTMPCQVNGLPAHELVPHLERLVGRLTLENQLLRASVTALQEHLHEAD